MCTCKFLVTWVCNQSLETTGLEDAVWYHSCLHNHISCCWTHFLMSTLNMPTEMFLLQNINGYNDKVETFEGSGSNNTRHCWRSILWWNKVTAVKLKHVHLLNQIRAILSFLHLSHFSSVPALLLHHLLSPSFSQQLHEELPSVLIWHVY